MVSQTHLPCRFWPRENVAIIKKDEEHELHMNVGGHESILQLFENGNVVDGGLVI